MAVPTLFSPITDLSPTRPIFIGTGVAAQTVTVCQTNTGLILGQTTVDENESWLVWCSQTLPSGPYSITAYYDLSQGYAPGFTFYVGSPPAQSATTAVSDNSPVLTSMTVVDSLRPLLQGFAPANATVVIDHAGGSPRYGSVVADANGDWELTPAVDLHLDANSWADIALIATDATGNPLSPWSAVTLTVIAMHKNASTTQPSAGMPTLTSSTNISTLLPTLTGTATPNSAVGVYGSGGSPFYGTAIANASGIWTLPLTTNLVLDANNQATITFAEHDSAGQPILPWGQARLTFSNASSIPPPAGTAPTLTSSTTIYSLRPTLFGLAAAGADIVVTGQGGQPVYGRTKADAQGNWTLYPSEDFVIGSNGFAFIQFSEFTGATQTSIWGNANLTLSTDAAGPVAAGTPPSLTSSTTVYSLRPTLTGIVAPNTDMVVAGPGGQPIYGSATANAQGIWTVYPAVNLVIGSNGFPYIEFAEFTGTQQTSAWGNASLTLSNNANGPLLPGTPPSLTSSTTVYSLRPTLSGIAAPNATVWVVAVGGQPVFGQATADAQGNWTLYPSVDLIMGANGFALIVFAEHTGNQTTSGWGSASLTLSSNAAGPLQSGTSPSLTSPTTAYSLRPMVYGIAAPGTDVMVVGPGGAPVYGRATTAANGYWTVIPGVELVVGSNGLAYIAFVEMTGTQRTSGWGDASLTISRHAGVAVPAGTPPSLTSSTIIYSLRPTLFGLTTPSCEVEFHGPGTPPTGLGGWPVYGRTTADAQGTWNFYPTMDLVIGSNGYALVHYTEFTQNVNTSQFGHANLIVSNNTNGPLQPGTPPTLNSSTTVYSLRPTLSGIAPPNKDVVVAAPGGQTIFGRTTADAQGNWTLYPSVDLIIGSNGYALILFAEYTGTLPTSGWGSASLTVSSNAAGALTAGTPPSLTRSTTVYSRRPTYSGIAAPGVDVVVVGSGGLPNFGRATADAQGNWSVFPDTDFVIGSNGLVYIAFAEFTGTQRTSGWGDASLTLSNNAAGPLPPGTPPSLTSSTTVYSRRPTLFGIAAPDAGLQVRGTGGQPYYGATTADAQGNWSLVPVTDLVLGANGLAYIAYIETTANQLTSGWGDASLNISGVTKMIVSGAVVLTQTT